MLAAANAGNALWNAAGCPRVKFSNAAASAFLRACWVTPSGAMLDVVEILSASDATLTDVEACKQDADSVGVRGSKEMPVSKANYQSVLEKRDEWPRFIAGLREPSRETRFRCRWMSVISMMGSASKGVVSSMIAWGATINRVRSGLHGRIWSDPQQCTCAEFAWLVLVFSASPLRKTFKSDRFAFWVLEDGSTDGALLSIKIAMWARQGK